ncbi:MAG: gluconeogenesis factor YvcK family protein, partial [Anaerolineales bacterium]
MGKIVSSQYSLTLLHPSGIVDGVQLRTNETSSNGQSMHGWRLLARWLEPGLGVKRWLLLMVFGTALIGLGVAVILLDFYWANPNSPLLSVLSLRVIPHNVRSILLGGVGTGILVYAVFRLNRALLAPYVRPGKPVVEVVANHRRLGRGPKIVAIGGGTGLSTLLRGLKAHTANLTAIVSVADDGGSSGRLRRSLNLPPPGDIRACLAALSADEGLLTKLFQYRFREGEELEGHSFGNLFIAALSGVTGSFQEGVLDAGRVLGIRGQVLPSTAQDIVLVADKEMAPTGKAVRVEGESRITEGIGRICRVQIEPSDPRAYPLALQAILNADMIVIGPGSLFTSVLPNLLIPEIASAIQASKAFKVFVCNVATQLGETDHLDCCDHLAAIEAHIGSILVDLVVVNNNLQINLPDGIEAV